MFSDVLCVSSQSAAWRSITSLILLSTLLGALLAPSLQNISDVFGLSMASLQFSNPSLHNVNGERIQRVEAGQQSMIRISMHSNLPHEQPFVIIVEVRDGSGITVQLSLQSGKVDANGNYTMETSWMPDKVCLYKYEGCNIYEIRTFAFTDFENPQILSAVAATSGIRVLESASQLQYHLSLNNQTFPIDYSFSNGDGQITKIDIDRPTATMTLHLVTPKDSQLSIVIPKELARLLTPGNNESDFEPAIFVDEMNVDPKQQIDSSTGAVTFVISLTQGSETLEIVGTFPA
jgi:hypothetical protein